MIQAEQIRNALLNLIAFVISVSVHEFGHAWMADRLGDRLPRAQGRLTLSPLAHSHWVGTILMPLLPLIAPGTPMVAWGKPVQTNPGSYSTRYFSRRTGHMLVALAGPFMNFVLALVVSAVFIILGKVGLLSNGAFEIIMRYLLPLNIVLMFFNLIPVAPLDGAAVLAGILPDSLQNVSAFLQRYGIIILFAMIIIPGVMTFLLTPAFLLFRVWADVLVGFVGR
jgi:Zn-dependent protease